MVVLGGIKSCVAPKELVKKKREGGHRWKRENTLFLDKGKPCGRRVPKRRKNRPYPKKRPPGPETVSVLFLKRKKKGTGQKKKNVQEKANTLGGGLDVRLPKEEREKNLGGLPRILEKREKGSPRGEPNLLTWHWRKKGGEGEGGDVQRREEKNVAHAVKKLNLLS